LGHEAFAAALVFLILATDGISFQWMDAGYSGQIYLVEADSHLQVMSPTLSEEKLAKEQENNLFLDLATKLRIEKTLESLGYDCGEIDGLFDNETRSAIRSFQNTWSFRETGYLDEVTFVRLLAIGIY